MGLTGSRALSPDQMAKHQRATGLSCAQLAQLYSRFRTLDRQSRGYLTPTDMLRIPQLVQHPLKRQIVDSFFPRRCGTATLSFGQFVGACATVLVPQFIYTKSLECCGPAPSGRADKMRLLCQMIDTQDLGYILMKDFRKFMGHLIEQRGGNLAELPLLEMQAFGLSPSPPAQLQYKEFECRLSAVDLEDRLSIRKWLVNELDVNEEAIRAAGTETGQVSVQPGMQAVHNT
ncbi:calcineurin B homologous protein 1 [Drosophila obscura]|uniref:calcineurin B homologous protein 1 n=1 Tax=Drosophila obscura TaxID=7282 RepID=UPI001BB1770E|nr:calcineurin B homologous protein 1 [Drosophila obscura]